MASAKEYGYFIKGSKLALIEKDTALDNDVNSRDYGPDVTNVRFKSPQSSITEGIELEYIYSPKYKLNANIYQNTALTHYRQSTTGTLELVDNESSYTNFNSAPNLTLSDPSHIVLRSAGRFNGLHKISSYNSVSTGTNNTIVTTTPFLTSDGGGAAMTAFDTTPTMYYYVDVLNDEADELPISEYLSKAVVYYLKAKTAEDQGNFQLKEVMMKEFYRIVEKSDNAKVHTIRRVAPSSAAIR